MKRYTVTLYVESGWGLTPEQIKSELYDACTEVPFGFNVTGVEPLDEEQDRG